MNDLLAKCGISCSCCPSFRENLQTDEDRQRCSEGWAKYLGFRISPEKLVKCDGCQAQKDENPVRYQNCIVRRCAVRTGVETCAQCSAYPCEEVPTVSLSVEAREKIASRLGAPIPEEDYLAFIEPYEGIRHLDAIYTSLDPDEIVEKIEVKPLRARVVDFPKDLSFVQGEMSAFEAVHKFLKGILSAQTKTYARQLLFKRRRPHILGLLWVLGLYSVFEEENGSQLLLDGAAHGSRKECGWLVRKRDNSLHGVVLQAAELTGDFGMKWEYVPLKKGWLLKLSFEEKEAGDSATLNALRQYTTRLSERYGEPVYAGNSRFTGEAFALFSKADMRVLSNY